MVIKKLNSIEKVKAQMEGADKILKQLAISDADGTPKMSLRVFTLAPGGHSPYHKHNYEHINYIISGNGALVDETGKENNVTAGDVALVEPNEKHQFKNISTNEDLIFICLVDKVLE